MKRGVSQYLNGLRDELGVCDLGRFTIIDHSIRDELEVAEIVSAIGVKSVVDIIRFPPERIAFHDTIASVVSNIQIEDHNMLHPIVNKIYQDIVMPKLDSFTETELPTIIQYVDQNIRKAMQNIDEGDDKSFLNSSIISRKVKEVTDMVDKRIESGKYKVGEFNTEETRSTIIEKITQDAIITEILGETIEKLVDDAILEALREKTVLNIAVQNAHEQSKEKEVILKPYTLHPSEERHTFILAGAPACGKGTVEILMIEEAHNLGIPWEDVMILNTDNYRSLLSENSELGPEIAKHANLNHDESRMVNYKIINKHYSRVKDGYAPHVLFDGVAIAQEKVDSGITDGGSVHIKMVTTPPEVSMERAGQRGQRTGRFVPMEVILEAHKDIPDNLHSIITNNVGKKIDFELYNSNVAMGAKPILIESGDLSTGEIIIHDLPALGTFHGGKYLNAGAKTLEAIWPNGEKILSNEILAIYSSHHELHVDIAHKQQSIFSLQDGKVVCAPGVAYVLKDQELIHALNVEDNDVQAQIKQILAESDKMISPAQNISNGSSISAPYIFPSHDAWNIPSSNVLGMLSAVTSPLAMIASTSSLELTGNSTFLSSTIGYDPLVYGAVLGISAVIIGVSGYLIYQTADAIDQKSKQSDGHRSI